MMNLQTLPIGRAFVSLKSFEDNEQTEAAREVVDRKDCTGEDIERFLKEANVRNDLFSGSVDVLIEGLYHVTKSLPRTVLALNSIQGQILHLLDSGHVSGLADLVFFSSAAKTTSRKDMVETIVTLLQCAVDNPSEEQQKYPILWASQLLDEINFKERGDADCMETLLRAGFDVFLYSSLSVASLTPDDLLFGAKQLQHMLAD